MHHVVFVVEKSKGSACEIKGYNGFDNKSSGISRSGRRDESEGTVTGGQVNNSYSIDPNLTVQIDCESSTTSIDTYNSSENGKNVLYE